MGVHHLLGRRGCSRRELDDGDRPLVPPLAGGPSTVTLLHPPLPLAGFSIATERGCQRSDSLVDGYVRLAGKAAVDYGAEKLLVGGAWEGAAAPPLSLQ